MKRYSSNVRQRLNMNLGRSTAAILLCSVLVGCGLPGYTSFEAGDSRLHQDVATYDYALDSRAIDYDPAFVEITPAVIQYQQALQLSSDLSPRVSKVSASHVLPTDYEIGVGDILNVIVYGHPELTNPGYASLGDDSSLRLVADAEMSRQLGSEMDLGGSPELARLTGTDLGQPPSGDSIAQEMPDIDGGAATFSRTNANAYSGSSAIGSMTNAAPGQGAPGMPRTSGFGTGPGGIQEPGQVQSPLGQLVDRDGDIYFPFVGTVRAAGLTPGQLRRKLTKGLSSYLRSPQVDVRLVSSRSKKVFVYGDIPKPCAIPFTDVGLTALEALERCNATGLNRLAAISGVSVEEGNDSRPTGVSGFRPSADERRSGGLSSISLIRDGETIELDLYQLYRAGRNVPLRPGDRLLIDSSADQIYLVGEFRQQRALAYSTGDVYLADAMAAAGGVDRDTTGAGISVYVFRRLLDEGRQIVDTGDRLVAKPLAYHLEAVPPDGLLLAAQFRLEPNDVVFASPAPVTNFNRALALVIPGLNELFRNVILYDRR